MANRKQGTVKIKSSIGYDDPEEIIEMLKNKDLEGYDGPVAETSVLIGLSLPIPTTGKMGPWVKSDVSVTMPCMPNEEAITKTSKFCEEFATKRVEEIVQKAIASMKA